jgi:hypothetical protein
MTRYLPAVAVLACAVALRSAYPLNHDVAWFLYVAEGLLAGGELYRDFVGTNAPMASLSLLPAALLARAGLSPYTALCVLTMVLALLSCGLCLGLAAQWQGPRRWRTWASAILLTAFLILPGYTFGQREHLFTILIGPYLLCLALRVAGIPVPARLAVMAGAMAGIGVGLKPHFVLIAAAAEMALLLRLQDLRRLFRPESLALAVCACAVVAEVFLFHLTYVFDILPGVVATYDGFNNPDLIAFSLVVYLALLWALSAAPAAAPVRDILLFAVAGALLSFVLQGKGWYYHGYPIVFLLFLLGGAAMAGKATARVGIALTLMVAASLVIARPPDPDDTDEMTVLLLATPGSFYIADSRVYPGFPLATTLQKPWASRFAFLMGLPAFVKAEASGDDSLAPWADKLRSDIAEDIARRRPAVVLAPSDTALMQSLPPGFDIIAWLSEDAGFAAAWAAYRADGKADNYLVYRRQ